jgi:hypothetical protein
MQKYKFGVTCPGGLFMEIASDPPEHEKLSFDVSHPRRTEIYYVTHRCHRMQKHWFGVTCSSALFMEAVPDPPEHEK